MSSFIGKIVHRIYNDANLDKKSAELIEYNEHNAKLMQELSQRDEQNAKLMQELSQIKQHNAELQTSICHLTIVEPIDIKKKLSSMVESWTSIDCKGHISQYPSRTQLDEVAAKIYAATEQIEEPIMDLFHVTYTHIDSNPWRSYADIVPSAFILTATNIYRLMYSSRGGTFTTPYINLHMDIYTLSYKWNNIGSIDSTINWKTLRKYITTISGSTGALTCNSNGNSPTLGVADKIAERLIKSMLDLVM
jgi:hypothetical protein